VSLHRDVHRRVAALAQGWGLSFSTVVNLLLRRVTVVDVESPRVDELDVVRIGRPRKDGR
jgi:hypothetical protein